MRERRVLMLLFVALLLAVQVVTSSGTGAAPVMSPTHTIAEARALPNGTTGVTVQGAISAPIGLFRYDEMWMQDVTAGIDVYGAIPAGLQLGDIVEVSGEIGEYNGKKEIMPAATSDVALVDRGVPPAPMVTDTGNIDETSEGWLVVITGTVDGYSGGGDNSFTLDDGSGAATIYRDSDTGIDLTWINNGDLLTLVGVGSQYDYSLPYDSGYQVLPRYQYDIAKGEVLPIALARQRNDGDVVTVQGAVTCVPGTFEAPDKNRELYVQDGTAGIDVFKYAGLSLPPGSLSIGDIVTVTGEIDFYNGKMEIIPSEVVTQGLNSPIAPKIQLAGNISEATEGLLVVITGTVSSKGVSGFDLSDSSGNTAVYIDGDTDIDLSGINNGDALQVIGLSAQYDSSAPYDSGYQITPRYQSDLTHVSGDFDPPGIASTDPASGATDANPYLPIRAFFDEDVKTSTINDTTFTLEDALGPVSGAVYYDSSHIAAIFDPDDPLVADTVYTATVMAAVEDKAGNPMGADYVWSFTTTAVTFDAYHGSIHNHTSYSDGTGTPDQAFAAGRERGLDFMAVTDHSYSISDAEWADTLAQVFSHSVDGTFIAFRGAEFTQGTEGHLNVYNTVRHPVRTDTTATCTSCDYTPTLADFYDWIAQHPEAVGMFNHPAWMNFNDWDYRADTEAMMQLLEVGNGAYSYYVWTEEEYRKALDYGWRVGPSNNGDTHSDEWAIDNPGRTGLWATELTYYGVLEALGAMRTFATEDGNFEIYLKADGAWMGETIPNDGAIDFEVYVNDPDGEDLVSLILYTDQGLVPIFALMVPTPYTWTFSLDISEGVHYYFVRAEQEDGDCTVTAPIWTAGDVDVAPTKLEITPAQLSTQAPANFSARVTNRGAADATNVTVTFQVDATVVGTEVITVPAGGDAFAAVGWAPDVTGLVSISAEISGVPAGDNPDDNTIIEQREIVAEAVPLVLIDAGHKNNLATPTDMADFLADLVRHGFNWLMDSDGLTADDLQNVVLLVITDPGEDADDGIYSGEEVQAIADYVNGGGALLMAGQSAYADHGNADELNRILDAIGGVNMRINYDELVDPTDNQSPQYPWGVLFHTFPVTQETGIGVNVERIQTWSGSSLVDASYGALEDTDGVTITVTGDDDTNNVVEGITNTHTYTAGSYPPQAAVQILVGGGRIAVWGESDDTFSSTYGYIPGDGKQSEIYIMETIHWLMGHPLEKSSIAEARADAEWDDTPDHLDELVWVEGTVTAEYGNFFDVLYVQDDTGGVTVYAPVTALTGTLTLGTQVRVVGRVETYQGDTEVQIDWDPEQVQIIGPGTVPDPLVLSTHDAALEENEGWLVQTSGRVVTVINDYSFVVDDGSGPARVFIDGYNGSFAGVGVIDFVQVIGLASEDGEGQRIRVRNQEDVLITPAHRIYLPLIFKNATP